MLAICSRLCRNELSLNYLRKKSVMQQVLSLRHWSGLSASTALIGTAALLLVISPAHAAFDPNADNGYTGPVISQTRSRLPDTSVLRGEAPRPLYAPGGSAAGISSGGYASPLKPIQMPKPLYPEKMQATEITSAPMAAPAPMSAPAPAPALAGMPEVDPAVAARAQAMMAAEQPAAPMPMPQPVAMTSGDGFIAPAPLLAQTPATAPAAVTVAPAAVASAPAPIIVPEPVGAMAPATPAPVAVAAAAPASTMNEQTRSILSTIPSRIDTVPAEKASKVSLARVSPQIQEVLGKEAQEDAYESVGLSIKVRRPGLDTNYELNNAYTALMGGDTQRAIEIYKNIIAAEPRNEDAMFGLAATYHRLGQVEQARPFYGMLLKQNPNHREGLNNFLVLVSDESPQDALPELERLELRNPDFAPIPAQIAIVLDKLGYPDQAQEKMLRAIEIAPENLTYKYNLAVMLDHHRKYADATALYSMLISAALRGEQVPASTESMQRRLNYLTTAMNEAQAGS